MMDPTSVLSAMWRQRWFALPALIITLITAIYLFQYGPRLYESTVSYALVNPSVPTEAQIEDDPALKGLNRDNPYLRASDPTLITDVLVTRLGSDDTADALVSAGLSPDYQVGRGAGGFVLDITGIGDSPEAALATKAAVGAILAEDIHVVQEVRGADRQYHYDALLIADSDSATERFSSRLRTVIAAFLAGGIFMMTAVSLGEWVSAARRRRRSNAGVHGVEPSHDGGPKHSRHDSDNFRQLEAHQTDDLFLTDISEHAETNDAASHLHPPAHIR